MTGMVRPKALFIAPAAPARTGNGLAMRLGTFLDAMTKVADTELLILPVSGPPPEAEELANAFGVAATTIPVAGRADTHLALISLLGSPAQKLAAFEAYGRGSRHASLSLPVLANVRDFAADRQFDLLHVGRLYIADAASAVVAPTCTLDLDEDDASAWRRRAGLARVAGETDLADWSEAEARAEDSLLHRVAARFDALFIAGGADRDRLTARHPELVPEIVVNSVAFPPASRRDDDGKTVVFVGSLGYAPNAEGLAWFANEVLPEIAAVTPMRLRIVGRGMSPAVSALRGHANIDLIGEVVDVAATYKDATIAIAPLHSGGGTRIKLIEAAAFGVPIVSTTLGAEGLDLGSDAMWCADNAAGFAAAIIAALSDPAERESRARKASRAARQLYDRDMVVDALACRFDEIIHKGPRHLAGDVRF